MNESPTTIEILYFTGSKCSVCHALKPKIIALVKEEFPKVALSFYDIEDDPETAAQNMVFTLPVLLIFVNAREQYRLARSFSIAEVREKLQRIADLMG